MNITIRTYHGHLTLNDIDEFVKMKNKADLKKLLQLLSWDYDATEDLQGHFQTLYYVPPTRREAEHRNYFYNGVMNL